MNHGVSPGDPMAMWEALAASAIARARHDERRLRRIEASFLAELEQFLLTSEARKGFEFVLGKLREYRAEHWPDLPLERERGP